MVSDYITTIKLYSTTRNQLKALGAKGQSYDKIVKQLLEKKRKTK